jgi:hypothetical protein
MYEYKCVIVFMNEFSNFTQYAFSLLTYFDPLLLIVCGVVLKMIILLTPFFCLSYDLKFWTKQKPAMFIFRNFFILNNIRLFLILKIKSSCSMHYLLTCCWHNRSMVNLIVLIFIKTRTRLFLRRYHKIQKYRHAQWNRQNTYLR